MTSACVAASSRPLSSARSAHCLMSHSISQARFLSALPIQVDRVPYTQLPAVRRGRRTRRSCWLVAASDRVRVRMAGFLARDS